MLLIRYVFQIHTHQSGRAYIQFIEYYDTSYCESNGCDFYFYNLEVYDSTRSKLVFVETTKSSSGSNTATVNLQDVTQLKGEFILTLQTNDTVKLSVTVRDYTGVSSDSIWVRSIIDLVIPFNTISASDTWTNKQLNLSNPSGYLKIEIKISCDQYFGGLGCNTYCKPVDGNYTCNTEGKKVCVEHWAGEYCDVCEVRWAGRHCQECAENYYPASLCNVKCLPVDGIKSCSNEGMKTCRENWKGVDCDTCAEHRTGGNCDQCIERWTGDKCQQCALNYYPTGVCNVECIPVNGQYSCSSEGKKVCHENWKGSNCDTCAEHRTGENCDQCTEGWAVNNASFVHCIITLLACVM